MCEKMMYRSILEVNNGNQPVPVSLKIEDHDTLSKKASQTSAGSLKSA